MGDVVHPAYGLLRPVTEYAAVLLARNPGPLTLEGTNTWILRQPGVRSCVVVDPGPVDEDHLQCIAALGPASAIFLTHGHRDHSAGAARCAELLNAPVFAVDPALRIDSPELVDGQLVEFSGLHLRILLTPGHTADSLCLSLETEDQCLSVLTGDTILGRGTTIIDHPSGSLRDYLVSLRRLTDFPTGILGLPGHGPEILDIAKTATQYLAHRGERLTQVRFALEQLGPTATARMITELVYANVDRHLWPAAEQSVAAQLLYLREIER